MTKQGFAVVALTLSSIACSEASGGRERAIWNANSSGIDFALTSFGNVLCEFSAQREELTSAQLDGLSALRLHGGTGGAACEGGYAITIHADDGSLMTFQALDLPQCSTSPILLFEEFDAWATSTPCFWPR
jgi:hypothetical protein